MGNQIANFHNQSHVTANQLLLDQSVIHIDSVDGLLPV